MSDHADISKHVKLYIFVFAALAAGTVLTVAAAQIHVSKPVGIAIALGIATVKASLVALIFMHLKWERSFSIWVALALCAVFFLLLLLVPMLSMQDMYQPFVEYGIWG